MLYIFNENILDQLKSNSTFIVIIEFQYTSVFGVEPLASFLFAPFLSRLGKILGPYKLFNCGNFAHSFCALAFGLIVLVQNASIFLFLSYLDRYLEEVGK